MDKPRRDLLVAVEDWYARHHEELLSTGISMRFRPSSPEAGRSTYSVGIDFQLGGVVANVQVWDSGECELMVFGDSDEPTVIIEQVNSVETVHALIDRAVVLLVEYGAT